MRSGRIGLSEYATQRLAELQAMREADDSKEIPAGQMSRYVQTSYHDDSHGSSRGEDSGNEGSPIRGLSSEAQSPTGRIALPSEILENKRSNTASKVGYSSLALPPDGAYRPLRSAFYGGNHFDKYPRYTESSSTAVEDTAVDDNSIKPLSSLPVTLEKKEETKKKSLSLEKMEGEKKSLAIKTDDGCIGFAKLPDQVHRKAIKRGFDLTLMVVGESGLGKSTLISSMFFQDDFYKDRNIPSAEDKMRKTVQVEKRQLEIEERGVKLRLTIVDTPGFNDAINSLDSWKPIYKYIQDRFEQYLQDESGLNRQAIQDHRVHCCLYFISPYGRGLRPVDIYFMKRLQNRVNIVPVIAKADVLTLKELQILKSKVMDEIKSHKIQIYELPPTENDEDEDFKRKDKALKTAYPFAVIGGNSVIEVDGKRVKGRVYPWGIVEAENPEYSDVTLLRQFLVSTHLHDLKEVTKDVHYENFRAAVIDEKAKTLPAISDTKSDAEKLLREKEEEIRRMHLMLQRMQSQLHGSYAR